jgi:hypothetical protein
MSAFVAFNGFPGQQVQDPIGTLLLQEKQTRVNVAPKPIRVQVQATTRSPAAGASRHTGTGHVQAPRASTGPVVHRTVPGSSTPTQSPSSSGQSPTSVTGSAPSAPINTTTPQVPDTGLPLPPITLPSLPSSPPPPPGNNQQQLPIDTSGITDLLGGQ